MNRQQPEAGAAPGESDGLLRLLAAERRLDRELVEARSRGEEIVASATAEVARQRERFAARLDAALERLGATIERDLASRIATIEEEAERLLRRYETAAGALDDLATGVARRVVRETLGSTAEPPDKVPP